LWTISTSFDVWWWFESFVPIATKAIDTWFNEINAKVASRKADLANAYAESFNVSSTVKKKIEQETKDIDKILEKARKPKVSTPWSASPTSQWGRWGGGSKDSEDQKQQ
jgi:hypothetical protein